VLLRGPAGPSSVSSVMTGPYFAKALAPAGTLGAVIRIG
jgi:hypothetical protein